MQIVSKMMAGPDICHEHKSNFSARFTSDKLPHMPYRIFVTDATHTIAHIASPGAILRTVHKAMIARSSWW